MAVGVNVEAAGDASRRSVLWVEDDRFVQATTEQLLVGAGFRVHCAADAEEALSVWAERSVGMVLTDLGLPRADGLALVSSIRAAESRDRRAPTRIVVLTGEPSRRAQALAAGADELLTKPAPIDRIVAALLAPSTGRVPVPGSGPFTGTARRPGG